MLQGDRLLRMWPAPALPGAGNSNGRLLPVSSAAWTNSVGPLKKVKILNQTRGCTLGDAIERADTSETRRVGLLKRSGLDKGQGLWIVPCEGIHTFFMKFAIDVVFLNRQRRVVKVVRRMPPWRLAMNLRARSVVELPPGTIESTGTAVGDVLEVVQS